MVCRGLILRVWYRLWGFDMVCQGLTLGMYGILGVILGSDMVCQGMILGV